MIKFFKESPLVLMGYVSIALISVGIGITTGTANGFLFAGIATAFFTMIVGALKYDF